MPGMASCVAQQAGASALVFLGTGEQACAVQGRARAAALHDGIESVLDRRAARRQVALRCAGSVSVAAFDRVGALAERRQPLQGKHCVIPHTATQRQRPVQRCQASFK